MSSHASEELLERAEAWFVSNGIPHFIDDFTAKEDVWTRALGILGFVFFAELFLTFGDNFSGVQQASVFAGGIAVAVGAFVVVNRLRGRSHFARPETVGVGELALFVLVPPVLAVLGGQRAATDVVQVVLFNLAVLVAVYLVLAWGLIPMLRWGLGAMWQHLTQVLQLLGKVLPLMLLFSAFLFLNAEIWQVVNDLPLVFFGLIVISLAAIGLFFLAGSMGGSIAHLRAFEDWNDVKSKLTGTPLEHCAVSDFTGAPQQVPLERSARLNLTMRVVVGLSAQVLLVTGLIFGFYILFGVLTVRSDTILQWTTLDQSGLDEVTLVSIFVAGERVVLTALHLVAAGVVASFSGLQFAVSLVTDENYRAEFVEDSNSEAREALAVHTAYLNLISNKL